MGHILKIKIKRVKYTRESSIACSKHVVIESRPRNKIYIGGLSKWNIKYVSELLDTACLLVEVSEADGYVIFINRKNIVSIVKLEKNVKPCKPSPSVEKEIWNGVTFSKTKYQL